MDKADSVYAWFPWSVGSCVLYFPGMSLQEHSKDLIIYIILFVHLCITEWHLCTQFSACCTVCKQTSTVILSNGYNHVQQVGSCGVLHANKFITGNLYQHTSE